MAKFSELLTLFGIPRLLQAPVQKRLVRVLKKVPLSNVRIVDNDTVEGKYVGPPQEQKYWQAVFDNIMVDALTRFRKISIKVTLTTSLKRMNSSLFYVYCKDKAGGTWSLPKKNFLN